MCPIADICAAADKSPRVLRAMAEPRVRVFRLLRCARRGSRLSPRSLTAQLPRSEFTPSMGSNMGYPEAACSDCPNINYLKYVTGGKRNFAPEQTVLPRKSPIHAVEAGSISN